jgi:hypothetical protein
VETTAMLGAEIEKGIAVNILDEGPLPLFATNG